MPDLVRESDRVVWMGDEIHPRTEAELLVESVIGRTAQTIANVIVHIEDDDPSDAITELVEENNKTLTNIIEQAITRARTVEAQLFSNDLLVRATKDELQLLRSLAQVIMKRPLLPTQKPKKKSHK